MKNIGLCFGRRGGAKGCFVTDKLTDGGLIDNGAYIAPLYLKMGGGHYGKSKRTC